MKKILVLLLLSMSVLFANAQTTINQFTFLLGNWEGKPESGKISEHWKKGSKTYTGASYKHNAKGDSTLTETIIIKQINGIWNYCVTGHEKNNTGTTNFKLISNKQNTFIFENKGHDFPQRIVYQSKEKDKLLAWIEGKMNGKQLKIDFPYHRKK